MKLCCIAIGLSSVLFAGSAIADDSVFPQITQIGTWRCSYPPGTTTLQALVMPCEFPFPKGDFAAAPTLLVFEEVKQDYRQEHSPRLLSSVSPDSVTAHGFRFNQTRYISIQLEHTGSFIAVGPGPLHARITPKYLVLSVLYAPPGGPKGTNAIEYQQTNTAGTSNSVSKSFRQEYSVVFEGSGGAMGGGAGDKMGFQHSHTKTDKDSFSLEISKTKSIIVRGHEGGDGVNNDDDEIIIAPKPGIDVNVGISSAVLSLDENGPPPARIKVEWLKYPAKFQEDAPGLKAYLESQDITESDYPDIWKHDPLAQDGSVPDPKRYEASSQFMYSPTTDCKGIGAPDTTRVTFSRKSTQVTEEIIADQYSVDLTHIDDFGFNAGIGHINTKLARSGRWTWTTQTSHSDSQAKIDTVSMSVGGPPCGSRTFPSMQAYLDKVYGTYAFRKPEGPLALTGNLDGKFFENVANNVDGPVKITIRESSGRESEVYPNAKGEWAITGDLKFPVTLSANGVTKVINSAPRDLNVQFAR